MKIALILASSKEFSPYIDCYLDLLKEQNINFDIIQWDKSGGAYEFKNCERTKTFRYYCNNNDNYFNKLKGYLLYKNYVEKNLKSQKYDKIVIFTIQLAYILNNILLREYKNKFILDIRDYSICVKNKLLLKKLLNNSAMNVISSEAYKEWLPKNNFIISHNCRKKFLEKYTENNILYKKQLPIKIATIGSIRDFEVNKKLLDAFENNKSFKLFFVGEGSCKNELIEYCKQKNIKNVEFKGYYQKKDELKIYSLYDIINNYPIENLNSRTCMSNRFYNSLISGKFIISDKISWMANISEEYNLGININYKEDINLEKEINNFLELKYNEKIYGVGRTLLIEKIKEEIINFENSFVQVIKR